MELTPEELTGIYTWVDEIPLSRPKKNIARDFSDGVLAAEVVSYYCPRLVDIHNYSAANSLAQKMYNWSTLNERVFKHFNLQLSKEDISAVAGAQPLVIEAFLKLLKSKLEKCPSSAARKCETDKADEECRPRVPRRHFFEKSSSADRTSILASHKAAAQLSDSETQTLASQENDSNGVVATPAPNTAQIRELQETIEVLEAKVFRLEQLMKLKGGKTGRLKRL